MRRWVLLLLLAVLPLQMVWGAAAPYCGHETTKAAKKHFGHHEHRHQAATPASSDSNAPGDSLATVHADCVSCHLACAASFDAGSSQSNVFVPGDTVEYRPPAFTSIVPSGLERPDRAPIATAARFGGGVGFALSNT